MRTLEEAEHSKGGKGRRKEKGPGNEKRWEKEER